MIRSSICFYWSIPQRIKVHLSGSSCNFDILPKGFTTLFYWSWRSIFKRHDDTHMFHEIIIFHIWQDHIQYRSVIVLFSFSSLSFVSVKDLVPLRTWQMFQPMVLIASIQKLVTKLIANTTKDVKKSLISSKDAIFIILKVSKNWVQ